MSKNSLREDARDWYVSNFNTFESNINGGKETPFHQIRKEALSKFSELGFPAVKDEEWKYTNVEPILKQQFNFGETNAPQADLIKKLTFEGIEESVLVFVNSKYNEQLSTISSKHPGGVILSNINDALKSHSGIINKYLGKYADFENESFTALNTAFTHDGLFVYVPGNTVVEDTIHIIYLSDGGSVSYPRNLVYVGKNSQVKIIETFYGVAQDSYFNNAVSEFIIEENANVEHVKIQDESTEAFHVSNVQIKQERNSVFTTINLDLGGSLIRNNVNVQLNDENSETHLLGFFMGKDSQHIDNHTFIDHAKPNCFSNELYKGILDDKSTGVFNGKILVRPDAQKTNALQSNKTLLLTDDASINAKPQLEIFADDVKCTHGATIGQLDDEALFYLRARGIGKEMANALLRHAFISDVLDNIKDESVRDTLDAQIIKRFTNSK